MVKETLSPRERLQACLADDTALDRPPVALWRHFPVDDQLPGKLAAATVNFQENHRFDLVKVTPASSFCLKDWGVQDAWDGNTEGTRQYTRRVINSPGDWENLPVLETSTAPHLKRQLDCLQMVRDALGDQIPILQTVFSPLAQAKNLAGGEVLINHLHKHPEAVLRGLDTISETTRRFINAAIGTGIDGIFFAVQHARADMLSLDEYRIFGLPYDQAALAPARSLWCNLLHLHGTGIYIDLLRDYQHIFSVINWHDRETKPSLAEARQIFTETLCGGISQRTITLGDHAQVRKEARDALRQTSGRKFILGTGCVVPVIAPYGNIAMAANMNDLCKDE